MVLLGVPLQQPFLPATSTAELRFGSVHALPTWATISRSNLKTVEHMQVLAFALQIAAVRVLARPQNPVKALTLNIFNKRGGATKPSLSLRGAGFRAYEKRTVARGRTCVCICSVHHPAWYRSARLACHSRANAWSSPCGPA